MLKAIAVNAALSNDAHVHHLPASWGTLAVLASLASLDADDIEAAIADGATHRGALVGGKRDHQTFKQAKADCSHGEWGELTGQTTGVSLLPFEYSTAYRYKKIAENAALSNDAHGHHLPASWRTLAVLASLDADDIEAAIADGATHRGALVGGKRDHQTFKQAKADCSHGEWGELTGQTTGVSLLPFEYSTAYRYKKIAENAALSNHAHAHHLPASWYTLAVLASLDADDIEAAIADRSIHRVGHWLQGAPVRAWEGLRLTDFGKTPVSWAAQRRDIRDRRTSPVGGNTPRVPSIPEVALPQIEDVPGRRRRRGFWNRKAIRGRGGGLDDPIGLRLGLWSRDTHGTLVKTFHDERQHLTTPRRA